MAVGSDNLHVNVGTKARAAKKYAIRAVVFQEGEWLCAQCLEYDLVAQAKTLPTLCRALQQLVVGHVALRLRHSQQPFRDVPRAPEKYWTMFRQSRLTLPAPLFKLGVLRSHGFIVGPPQIRIAVPSAARRGAALPNDLALCKLHHAAFDANIIGVTPDLGVTVRLDVLQEIDGPMLQHGLQGSVASCPSATPSCAVRAGRPYPPVGTCPFGHVDTKNPRCVE